MMESSAQWRPMRRDDLLMVKAMSDAIHGPLTEAEAVYAEKWMLYPAGCLVFDMEGVAAGYLLTHPWRSAEPPKLDAALGAIPIDADCFYIHDIALMPTARGHGAGRAAMAIVEALAQRAQMSELRLIAVNGADSFWRAMGFESVGPADGGYGEGAWIMRRPV